MKGIAHFISGVAAASFYPWAVEAAQNGNPAFFILGAVAGILPDTIDFKFYRYFYHHEIYVYPHPDKLDPQPVADAIAAAITEAAATGRPVRVKLSTIQLSADNWRQYRVRIDSDTGEVRMQFGPVVSTGQMPQPDTRGESRPVAVAKFSAAVRQSYEPVYTVDIFDGPSFLFKRIESGAVEIEFLPWHRNWSHSFAVGALLAGAVSLWSWQAGAVVFSAYAIHIIEDQLGYMGSNLFSPFSRKRSPGLKWMRSGDALPNFTTVWFCCLLIFWNLYAAIPDPFYYFSFIRLMTYAMIIPFVVFGTVRWLLVRADKGQPEDLVTDWKI